MPVGRVSVRVTTPAVSCMPILVTASVYVKLLPRIHGPSPDFAAVKSEAHLAPESMPGTALKTAEEDVTPLDPAVELKEFKACVVSPFAPPLTSVEAAEELVRI